MNENSTFFSMVACIARHELWSSLKPVWNRMLKGHGLRHFHMWEFAGFRGPFNGWTENQRRALMSDILELIQDAPIYAIGATMRVADFERLPVGTQKAYIGPYAICFQELVYGTGMEGLFGFPGERIDFVYSRQDQFKRHMKGIWEYSQNHRNYGKRLGALAFIDMREEPGLQVADIFAWEFRHYFHLKETRSDLPMRYSFRKLLNGQLELHSKRLLYLPQWYINFQVSDAFDEAMKIIAEHPEAWGHMSAERHLPGMDPMDGVEMMRVLERLRPYPVPDQIPKTELLQPPQEYIGGYRRTLWPLMVSTNFKD